jgi:hypothetical protein
MSTALPATADEQKIASERAVRSFAMAGFYLARPMNFSVRRIKP